MDGRVLRSEEEGAGRRVRVRSERCVAVQPNPHPNPLFLTHQVRAIRGPSSRPKGEGLCAVAYLKWCTKPTWKPPGSQPMISGDWRCAAQMPTPAPSAAPASTSVCQWPWTFMRATAS